MLEKDTSSSTVMGTFNSNSGEQLNICWSFISLECEVEKQLSWITKIKPKPMMEGSLVLSVRQLNDGQNHLFSYINVHKTVSFTTFWRLKSVL